jgi:hypothetical protein
MQHIRFGVKAWTLSHSEFCASVFGGGTQIVAAAKQSITTIPREAMNTKSQRNKKT